MHGKKVKKVQNGQNKRVMLLCIDSYKDRIPEGFLYCLCRKEKQTFHGLMHLLEQVNRTLEEAEVRQEHPPGIRTFGKPMPCTAPENENMPTARGKTATFVIRILFRQNASWQGSVQWREGDMEESFRSALELCFLLDSALKQSKTEAK